MDLGLEGGFSVHRDCINQKMNPDFIEKNGRNGWVKLQSTRFRIVFANDILKEARTAWVSGRVYHRGGAVVQDGERYEDFETATGYGTGPGLCGWNCRHNFYPYNKFKSWAWEQDQ